MHTRFGAATLSVAVLGVLAAVAFTLSLPAALRSAATVCDPDAECPAGRLTAQSARQLADLGLTPAGYSLYVTLLGTVLAAVFGVVAALLLRLAGRRPAVAPTAAVLVLLGLAFPQTLAVAALDHTVWQVAAALIEHLAVIALTWWVVTFPDGVVRPRWARWLLAAVVVVQGATMAGWRFDTVLQAALTAVWLVALGTAAFHRYRSAGAPEDRQRVRVVTLGVATALAGLLVATVAQLLLGAVPGTVADLVVQAGLVLCFMCIPLSVAVALLRRGLWGVEASVSRAVTYGALAVGITGAYTATVAAGAAVTTVDATAAAAVSGGVLALAVHPVHRSLRRSVDRLLYGDREQAEKLLASVRLIPGEAADDVLTSFAQLVTQTLRLPYARLTVGDGTAPCGHGQAGLLESGWPVDDVPLTEHGRRVGCLQVARRDPDGPVDQGDRLALEAVARQAASLAGTVLLSEQLRVSRMELVTAREEERRRLRNDLHDGLGPALGAVTLKLAAAGNRFAEEPDAARDLVEQARQQTADAIADVRRLVHGLRPPALDELGLVAAVQAHASRLETDGLRVNVHAPASLPALPAAVEVAAYRIALEAVTNVLRHASATTCDVEIAWSEGRLTVTVTDDGVGTDTDAVARRPGVGLASMADRVTELGGTLDLDAAPSGGTRLCAVLPLGPDAG